MVAVVIIDIKNKQVNRSFDYLIPEHLQGIIKIGFRVKVSFGNTIRTGYVIDIVDNKESNFKLKYILDVVDVKQILDEEFVSIGMNIAENNFSYYASAFETMIPTALKMKYRKICKIVNKDLLREEAKNIFKSRDELIFDNLNDELQKIIYDEVKNGSVVLETRLKRNILDKKITYIHLCDETIEPKSKQGKLILDYLVELGCDIELDIILDDCNVSKNVIKTLEAQGIISLYDKEIHEYDDNISEIEDKVVTLNSKQEAVYNALDYNKYQTYLLHGVTGSGKTEIYMRWIQDVTSGGKGALMLVPEISLTPQITQILKARFKKDIAILHSRLTTREKYNAWMKIINHEVKIVVGARSAIFAPIKNLGIIIIDEAHENSYIQTNNPRYDVIEVAKIRSIHHNTPLVLGSATPKVFDYYKALEGEYKLLSLPIRANNKPLPSSEIVDMKDELISGNKSVLSRRLQTGIIEAYRNKKQSILFLNRRGYSSFVMCRSCGEAVTCPHCDVSLTYHHKTDVLKCHYCGYTEMFERRCRKCGSDKIRYVGSGTEKIIEALHTILPEARVIRLDSDTVTSIEDYENAYNTFRRHEADILVGTQMITKGLDFKDVTLVGVVNADLALKYPTIDANEVAYQLIEQVSGRAGRSDSEGHVVIQTYNPEHFVIKAAASHNYDMFYTKEIMHRRIQMLPPFSSYLEIEVQSASRDLALQEARHIKEALQKVGKNSVILGPTEAPIFKRKDIYTYLIQLQALEDSVLDKIKELYPYYQNNKDITLNIKRM